MRLHSGLCQRERDFNKTTEPAVPLYCLDNNRWGKIVNPTSFGLLEIQVSWILVDRGPWTSCGCSSVGIPSAILVSSRTVRLSDLSRITQHLEFWSEVRLEVRDGQSRHHHAQALCVEPLTYTCTVQPNKMGGFQQRHHRPSYPSSAS